MEINGRLQDLGKSRRIYTGNNKRAENWTTRTKQNLIGKHPTGLGDHCHVDIKKREILKNKIRSSVEVGIRNT